VLLVHQGVDLAENLTVLHVQITSRGQCGSSRP
jgi:hypothetical protein